METNVWQQVSVVTESSIEVNLWRLWLASEEGAFSAGERWLSEAENARSERLYHERDRRRFVSGRIALRALLKSCLGIDPGELAFSYNTFGKPALVGQGTGRLFFNVSHSSGLMVCAISKAGEVGVDVERIRDVTEAEGILQTHFPSAVGAEWRRLPTEQRAEAFLRLWVRHEAHLKCSGTGLAGAEHALPVRGDKSVIEFVPADGFVGAVVF